MKHLKLGLFGLCAIVLCGATGCTDNNSQPIDGTVFSTHYIQKYTQAQTLTIRTMPDEGCVKLLIDGKHITHHDETAFRDLYTQYGDTDFNGYLVPYTMQAVATEFTSIDVTCDRAFDPAHPAESSLADLVTLAGASAYPYLQSGYTASFDWRTAPADYRFEAEPVAHYGSGFSPVNNRLDALSPDDLRLLDPTLYLRFKTSPAQTGTYLFTVTMTCTERTISQTFPLTF